MYTPRACCKMVEPGLGSQPGYPSLWITLAPANSNTDATICFTILFRDSTELRWLVPTSTRCPSIILIEARLVEVSTKPGISLLMPITPWGQAHSERINFRDVPFFNT